MALVWYRLWQKGDLLSSSGWCGSSLLLLGTDEGFRVELGVVSAEAPIIYLNFI